MTSRGAGSEPASRARQWNARRQRARRLALALRPLRFFAGTPRLLGPDPGLFPSVLGHLFDDRRLSHAGPFATLHSQVIAQIVDGVLHGVQVAMKSAQLGPDPIGGVLGAFLVGDDHQVVFGDHVIGQAHLVEQELQTRLQANPVELELNGGLSGSTLFRSSAARSSTTAPLSVSFKCAQTCSREVGRANGKRYGRRSAS